MSDSLTIVIPYYKLGYLDAALGSLAAQTCRDFKVFIGDDASPEDPKKLLQKYEDRLNVRYHRFSENLGRTSLVKQWARCVQETKSGWVWLFSDDDVAEPDCVQRFFDTLRETDASFDVYRFNTDVIDGNGAILNQSPEHPRVESGADLALAKAMGRRSSFGCEYIFKRSAFDAAGGFVEFPIAWFSDDASWIAFSRRTGICTVAQSKVLWRMSGVNFSSPNPEHASRKLAALRGYLEWLKREFPDAEFQKKIINEFRQRIPMQIEYWGGSPGVLDGFRFWLFFIGYSRGLNLLLLRSFLGLTGLRARLGLRKATPHACCG